MDRRISQRVANEPSSSATRWARTARRIVGLAIAGAVLLAAASALAAHFGLFVPSWARFSDHTLSVDLDGDGAAEEVSLAQGRLSVSGGSAAQAYATPSSWKVMDALVCDVDGDGTQELAMLVWRRGNYGSSRPFWDTGLDLRMTEHLYLLCLRDGQMEPFWMGHDLEREVTSFSFDPATRTLTLDERNGTSTAWIWEGFGFVLADE